MAERTVNRISRRLEEGVGKALPACKTAEIPLCGNAFKNFKKVEKYMETIGKRLEKDGFEPVVARVLVTTYFEDSDNTWRLLKAELHFGVLHEMVQNPMDFFIRRTGRLYFDILTIREYLHPVASECGQLLGAGEDAVASWIQIMEKELELHSTFDLERSTV